MSQNIGNTNFFRFTRFLIPFHLYMSHRPFTFDVSVAVGGAVGAEGNGGVVGAEVGIGQANVVDGRELRGIR